MIIQFCILYLGVKCSMFNRGWVKSSICPHPLPTELLLQLDTTPQAFYVSLRVKAKQQPQQEVFLLSPFNRWKPEAH